MRLAMANPSPSHSRKSEEAITRGTDNVFADLGYRDAEERQTKLRLAYAINEIIASKRLSQSDAAMRLGVGQPRSQTTSSKAFPSSGARSRRGDHDQEEAPLPGRPRPGRGGLSLRETGPGHESRRPFHRRERDRRDFRPLLRPRRAERQQGRERGRIALRRAPEPLPRQRVRGCWNCRKGVNFPIRLEVALPGKYRLIL